MILINDFIDILHGFISIIIIYILLIKKFKYKILLIYNRIKYGIKYSWIHWGTFHICWSRANKYFILCGSIY